MIPLEWMHIVPVEDLQPGDLAFLLELESEKVLIGGLGGDAPTMVAFPDDPAASAVRLDHFEGNALVIRDWQVEVDYTKLVRMDYLDRRAGALIVLSGRVAIACPPPRGGQPTVFLPLREVEMPNPPARYAFTDWRIFKMHGDEKVVFAERSTPATEPITV